MKDKINVLSLFDGIACGYEALNKAGIQVGTYYASEIDKYAMSIASKNHSDIIQLGDVNNWKDWNIKWESIDLLIGGSPCTSLSVAGKQAGFNGQSGLFFRYVEILEHLKKYNPNIKFLLENVKMKKEWEDIITNNLGVKSIFINSALLSAQSRKRLYWTNISHITIPEDKHIILQDILLENTYTDIDKSYCIDANYHKDIPNDTFYCYGGCRFNALGCPFMDYSKIAGSKYCHYIKGGIYDACLYDSCKICGVNEFDESEDN